MAQGQSRGGTSCAWGAEHAPHMQELRNTPTMLSSAQLRPRTTRRDVLVAMANPSLPFLC